MTAPDAIETQFQQLTAFSETFQSTHRLENFLKEFDHQPVHLNFVWSFPRSGNGFVRALLTKLMLMKAGYDVDRMTQEWYYHVEQSVRAHRFAFPDRDEKISVEEIVPDLYINDPKRIMSLPERFLFGRTRIVKTHHPIPQQGPDFAYLFRHPKYACTSYFQLAGGQELTEQTLNGAHPVLFTRTVTRFLEIYSQMGQFALDAIHRGQAMPLSLSRMEEQNFDQVIEWLQKIGFHCTSEDLGRVSRTTAVRSGFKRELFGLWGPELSTPLEQALDVYERLQKA